MGMIVTLATLILSGSTMDRQCDCPGGCDDEDCKCSYVSENYNLTDDGAGSAEPAGKRLCRAACIKFRECDRSFHGGSELLADSWLADCFLTCEDEGAITVGMAACLVGSACEEIEERCGFKSP